METKEGATKTARRGGLVRAGDGSTREAAALIGGVLEVWADRVVAALLDGCS